MVVRKLVYCNSYYQRCNVLSRWSAGGDLKALAYLFPDKISPDMKRAKGLTRAIDICNRRNDSGFRTYETNWTNHSKSPQSTFNVIQGDLSRQRDQHGVYPFIALTSQHAALFKK